ncbi:prepilin peptidase [Lachnospiraceae bacterium ZAX-1]
MKRLQKNLREYKFNEKGNQMQLAVYIIVVLYGLAVGSFVCVCIDRIPEGTDIVKTPSSCPKCGRRLRAGELMPVFSWLFLRGKCHGCGEHISIQYPLVELSNAVLWLLCVWRVGNGLDLLTISTTTILAVLIACFTMSVLLAIAVTDAKTGIIPVGYNIALLVLGVFHLGITGEYTLHLIGAIAVSLPLYGIYLISNATAIGGGDIKFLVGAGVLLGWKLIILAFVTACILGTIVHGFRMIIGKASRTVRLGPYLAAGAALSWLFGNAAIAWYIHIAGL